MTEPGCAPAGHSIEAVVDDDAEVVRALKAAGFAVLQATWAAHSRRVASTLERAQEEQGRT